MLIGWIRLDGCFLLFADGKNLKKYQKNGIKGLLKRRKMVAGINGSGIAMAESVWEGKTGDLLQKSLESSKNLEEACYSYMREFQKKGNAKVNLLVCNDERGINLELHGAKFSLAQNEYMMARSDHFEVFTDLNKDSRKSEEKLEEAKKLLASKSPGELSKHYSVIKAGKEVEFL
jgi:hypothetical protein